MLETAILKYVLNVLILIMFEAIHKKHTKNNINRQKLKPHIYLVFVKG